MELQLDHIVHFIKRSPKKAVEQWEKHGFQAVMGGSHEQWGTHNSLLYLRSSYLEYLAVENEEIARESDNPLIIQLVNDLKKGEGLGQICFRTSNILDVKNKLEEKGCKTYPIFPGSRKRADGTIIKWKMLFIQEEANLPYPFFIEWDQNDEVRFSDLKERGMIDEKLEKHYVNSIYFACKHGEKTAIKWTELFNFSLLERKIDKKNFSKNTTISCGSTKLIFCEPIKDEGIIHSILSLRGDRPFCIIFSPNVFSQPISLYDSIYL